MVLRRLLVETIAEGLLISVRLLLLLLRALIAQILILIRLQVELVVGWRAMLLLYILCVVLWPVNRLELVWVVRVIIRVGWFLFKALSLLLGLNWLLSAVHQMLMTAFRCHCPNTLIVRNT